MESYWGCKNPEFQFNIAIINEFSGRESDEFNDFFWSIDILKIKFRKLKYIFI